MTNKRIDQQVKEYRKKLLENQRKRLKHKKLVQERLNIVAKAAREILDIQKQMPPEMKAKLKTNPELYKTFKLTQQSLQNMVNKPTKQNFAKAIHFTDSVEDWMENVYGVKDSISDALTKREEEIIKTLSSKKQKELGRINLSNEIAENKASQAFWDKHYSKPEYISKETEKAMIESLQHIKPGEAVLGSGRFKHVKGKLVFEPIASSIVKSPANVSHLTPPSSHDSRTQSKCFFHSHKTRRKIRRGNPINS